MKLGYTQSVTMLGPQASATTARSASLDTALYGGTDYVSVYVPVNIEVNTDSTNVILDVLHCDTTVVTSHTSLGTVRIDNTAASTGVYHANWIGKGRYLRVTATPDTTTNGAQVIGGIVAVLNPSIRGLAVHSNTSQKIVA